MLTDLDPAALVDNPAEMVGTISRDLLACLHEGRPPLPSETTVAFQYGALCASHGTPVEEAVGFLGTMLGEQIDVYARLIWAAPGAADRFADEADVRGFLRDLWGSRLAVAVEDYCDMATAGYRSQTLAALMRFAGTA